MTASGAIPTIRKAWADPHSERPGFYALSGVNAAIALVTIDAWEPDAWAFPGYMLVLSLTLTTIIGLRRPRTRSSSPGVS